MIFSFFSGDNTGPHEDATYKWEITKYCEDMGWKWVPQGSQMVHVNVCDHLVFLNISKSHTQLPRDHHGMHVITEDQI